VAVVDLTLQQVADVLGVHYMTVYRYVRLGLLPAQKSNGVWRVTGSDLDAFRAERTSPPGVVAETAGRSTGRSTGRSVAVGRRRWADRLELRLIAGDATGAWRVVEAAQASGVDPVDVYNEMLAPALASIGARWERGEIDIAVEHRASAVALRVIGRVGPRFLRRGRPRGQVVVAAPSGELHALPLAILGDLLRFDGWDVVDLGANLPPASLGHAIGELPDVLAAGVSVMTDAGLASAAESCAAVRVVRPDLLIVAGGPAVRDQAHAVELGADAAAHTASEFSSLLGVRARM
jgi:excisionase family DNA binding protein